MRPDGLADVTGAPVRYYEATLGWQHWFSPQFVSGPRSLIGVPMAPLPSMAARTTTRMFAMDPSIHFYRDFASD